MVFIFFILRSCLPLSGCQSCWETANYKTVCHFSRLSDNFIISKVQNEIRTVSREKITQSFESWDESPKSLRKLPSVIFLVKLVKGSPLFFFFFVFLFPPPLGLLRLLFKSASPLRTITLNRVFPFLNKNNTLNKERK